jgi:hypothetical protein
MAAPGAREEGLEKRPSQGMGASAATGEAVSWREGTVTAEASTLKEDSGPWAKGCSSRRLGVAVESLRRVSNTAERRRHTTEVELSMAGKKRIGGWSGRGSSVDGREEGEVKREGGLMDEE